MNSDDIKYNWQKINEIVRNKALKCGRNPDEIRIISVSKTHPAEIIRIGLESGIRIFGENYVQELMDKQAEFEKSEIKPEWHFIGHLQSNKVKYLASFINMIHSVDSHHLAEEISKYAIKLNRTIDILLQVNSSGELSKSGCEPDAALRLFESVSALPGIKIKGLMTIGSFSDDETVYRSEFRLVNDLMKQINRQFPDADLKELSMGMSGDFETAIEEGSTMLRIGSAIFGARYYHS